MSRRDQLLACVAVLCGVALSALFGWLDQFSRSGSSVTGVSWMRSLVAADAALSAIFAFAAPARFWLWPLLICGGFYFAGFFYLEHWGQLLPFELVLMAILAVPGILTGSLVVSLRNPSISTRRAREE